MPKLNPTLLRQKLADLIISELREGRWSESLPGLRLLAAHYGVSKRTCSEALKLVEQSGMLEPAQERTKRKITTQVTDKPVKAPGSGQLLIVSDLSEKCGNTSFKLIDQITRLWIKRGGSVRRLEVDFTRNRSPATLLREWFGANLVECVVLVCAPINWSAAIDGVGVPVFLYGGPKGGQKHSVNVGYHLKSALTTVLTHLGGRGHRRILIPRQRARQDLRHVCLEVIGEVFAGIGASRAEAMVPLVDLVSAQDFHTYWGPALSGSGPTGVVLFSALEALSLISYCAGQGIRIPRDLSLVVMDDSNLVEWFTPALTHLKFDDEGEFNGFKRWMKGGFPPGSRIYTRFELIQGASVANLQTKPHRPIPGP